MDAITAEVIGPSGPVYMNLDLKSNGGHGTFRPGTNVIKLFLSVIYGLQTKLNKLECLSLPGHSCLV